MKRKRNGKRCREVHRVDPCRLTSGYYRDNKKIGQGDIAGSYSADRISEGKPIRSSFEFDGKMWVCTGIYSDFFYANRIVHIDTFDGQAVSYREKCTAPDDPHGFYHGIKVSHHGQTYVMVEPSAAFIEGEREQTSLF